MGERSVAARGDGGGGDCRGGGDCSGGGGCHAAGDRGWARLVRVASGRLGRVWGLAGEAGPDVSSASASPTEVGPWSSLSLMTGGGVPVGGIPNSCRA